MISGNQNIAQDQQIEIYISIAKDDDYELIFPLLKEGDHITIKIRWKFFDPKKPKIKKFVFIEVRIKILNISFNSDTG